MILGFPRAKQGLCDTKHGGAGGIILWAFLTIFLVYHRLRQFCHGIFISIWYSIFHYTCFRDFRIDSSIWSTDFFRYCHCIRLKVIPSSCLCVCVCESALCRFVVYRWDIFSQIRRCWGDTDLHADKLWGYLSLNVGLKTQSIWWFCFSCKTLTTTHKDIIIAIVIKTGITTHILFNIPLHLLPQFPVRSSVNNICSAIFVQMNFECNIVCANLSLKY